MTCIATRKECSASRVRCWAHIVSLMSLLQLVDSNIPSVHAGEDLLIRAKVDGRITSLYEKVVVVSAKATLAAEPGGRGEPIEPFAIFFKLRTSNGQTEQNGHVRVGDSTGSPKGWIKADDVAAWNTRFVLEPLQPVPGRTFSVDLGSGTRANLNTVAEGKRRFALITRGAGAEGDDPAYPVVVYAGNVQAQGAGGTLARERNQLRDLKLEIVFVIEASDFMLGEFDGVKVGDSVKDAITKAVDSVRKNPALRDAVRFGLAEYQDTSKEADFDCRLTCPLTSSADEFLSKLRVMSPKEIKGDWPDDVLAGLNIAVREAGWSENSSKHIILFGSSSCQLYPKGEGPNQLGGNWNSLTRKFDRSNPETDCGWNTTGLSIAQLIARANPQGGSAADKARSGRTFHTILSNKKLEKLPGDLEGVVEKVVQSSDEELDRLFQSLAEDKGKDTAIQLILMCFRYYLAHHQRDFARKQYKEIADNDGVHGLRLEMEPDADSVRSTAQQIAIKLEETFKTLEDTRSGQVSTAQLEQKSNELTQTFYAIVGAAAEKFKDKPAITGTASVRDERGREVAQKKVLVSRNELQRLRSKLDAIHTKFQARVAKADRQDAGQILADLKQITVETSAGQADFAADVKLKDVITDLPLRTTILDTTPRDIAVMDSDTFKQWLNKIEATLFRINDLLDGNNKTEWLELSSVAQNDRFTFLRFNELP